LTFAHRGNVVSILSRPPRLAPRTCPQPGMAQGIGLGQGTSRVLVTDIYARRCVVTGERPLPILQAAHINPVAPGGPHDRRNGLLLRSDLHTPFDRGYITVSADLQLKVGGRICEK